MSVPIPPSSGIGRLTALVLGLVVFVCVSMIGGAGYIKHQLDRAETTLAAPDSANIPAQSSFSRLNQELGFGGFLGLAQQFLVLHDSSSLPAMREHINNANDIVAALSERVPLPTKQSLNAIVALFNGAFRQMKASAEGASTGSLNTNDLEPLYAALPEINRLQAATNADARLEAKNRAGFWAMILTLISWVSLIVAAACACGIYLALREKRSAPMRALIQSIENMAHGDMRTPVWGIERQDTIGDLARAMDMARYHFSHLPDISVLSEQGPVRMRFEGGTRSLFEAMMKALSTDSETIRKQSSTLTNAVDHQREALTSLFEKVEHILKTLGSRGEKGDKEISKAIQDMVTSTENLKNAHAHATDQLTRLLPDLENRSKSLAEITQITGKQLTHALQSLMSSEITLKANAVQSKETLSKLSSTADDLGERLFGAVNLLQASGKVLGETTATIKAQWNDVALPQQSWLERLDRVTEQLETIQSKVDAQTDAQFGIVQALEETSQRSQKARKDSLAPLTSALETVTSTLDGIKETLGAQTALSSPSAAPLDLTPVIAKLDALAEAQAHLDQAPVAPPLDLAPLTDKVKELAELNGRVAVFVSALPGDLRQALKDELKEQAPAAPLSPPDIQAPLTRLEETLTRRLEAQCLESSQKQQEVDARLEALQKTLSATQKLAEAACDEILNPKPRKNTDVLPPEDQRKLLDQWFQMSAQIEALRSELMETFATQIRDLEARVQEQRTATRSASEYNLQLQIEKQTEILTELVGTLGLLDNHVQHITDEMLSSKSA
ncbi:MAG: hypothetical protein PHS57_01985 [Alphaproteobacteria bacterium]|nr:hypothetical protein [Alphaproteobacteria bacterium]